MNALQHALQQSLAAFPQLKRLWVGLSGGLDSCVLLHACQSIVAEQQLQLYALHVNHGLSANADHWQAFAKDFAAQVGAEFCALPVSVREQGKGIEDAARTARYEAFDRTLAEHAGTPATDVLLLAHHQDDQVETLLLNLLRGAGVRGARGMSTVSERSHGTCVRPWLNLPQQQLRDYAANHQLEWVDDESNQSLQFNRNYLRHQILPLIAERWPGYRATLSRFSTTQANTQQLIEQWSSEDLAQVLDANNRIDLAGLCTFSLERQMHILHTWILSVSQQLPPAAQLEEFLRQVNQAAAQKTACIEWQDWAIRQSQNWLCLVAQQCAPELPFNYHWQDLTIPLVVAETAQQLLMQKAHQTDSNLTLLPPANNVAVTVRSRSGGERIRLPNRAHSTSLKKLFQAAQIPHWQRNQLPLIYYGAHLVCVPGVAVAAEFASDADDAIVFSLYSDREPPRV
ncbi:MAG: tRNA lysidine(34) synthetase TilS [Gammaproteobacteria bacterium]|nr:tRNA lysidine(34) synthetase TilS [Gammaproteobacteria bacterium]